MEGPGVAPNVRSNVTFLLGLILGLKIVKRLCTGDFPVKLLGLWKNRKIYLPTPASLTPPLRWEGSSGVRPRTPPEVSIALSAPLPSLGRSWHCSLGSPPLLGAGSWQGGRGVRLLP